MPVQIFLTRKQTNAVKALMKKHPEKYRFLPGYVNFEFLPEGSSEFDPLSFRVVRFRISDDSMETLITNLDKDSFPADDLKHLYHLRWGIETSFRQLKYTIGLSLFQSKKVEYITQEIFARLTMWVVLLFFMKGDSNQFQCKAPVEPYPLWPGPQRYVHAFVSPVLCPQHNSL